MEIYYYPKTIWNITIALCDLFNDISIYRHDISGNRISSIDVPLTFGPVTKMQQAREVDHPSDETRYYMSVPRMAVVLNGITQNPDRAYSLNEERFWVDDILELDSGDSVYKDFQPTPYDFSFTLFIRSNSLEDLSQILENVLPYFNPKLYLRLREFSFLNVERDWPVQLSDVNLDFTDELDSETMREVNASIDMNVEGWMYKPVTSGALVKIINSKFFIGESAGYYSNGEPISATNYNIRESSQITEGYLEESDIVIPTSGFTTSGYNVDSGKYWAQNDI
jgi:hypothetical protein